MELASVGDPGVKPIPPSAFCRPRSQVTARVAAAPVSGDPSATSAWTAAAVELLSTAAGTHGAVVSAR